MWVALHNNMFFIKVLISLLNPLVREKKMDWPYIYVIGWLPNNMKLFFVLKASLIDKDIGIVLQKENC